MDYNGFNCWSSSKYLTPGDEGLNWPMTIGLGLLGSFVGGGIASLLGLGGDSFVWSTVIATAGALLVLFVYNKYIKK